MAGARNHVAKEHSQYMPFAQAYSKTQVITVPGLRQIYNGE